MGPKRQIAGALFMLLALTAMMLVIGEGCIPMRR